jgi:glutamyl-tRNA synthetase
VDTRNGPALAQVIALVKERVSTLEELAAAVRYFYRATAPSDELKRQHYSAEARPALEDLKGKLAAVEWKREPINEAIKSVVAAHKLKMPKVAMPLRVMITGTAQSPSVDAVLELIGREEVLARMNRQLASFAV